MIRTARCACGALSATAEGEPLRVAACSCSYCQRRSGSAFGLSAYWPAEAVTLSGEARSWRRVSQRGRDFEHFFCPTCGTALWWRAAMKPEWIGLAAGAFAAPDFPPPVAAVWDTGRYAWVRFPEDCEPLDEQLF